MEAHAYSPGLAPTEPGLKNSEEWNYKPLHFILYLLYQLQHIYFIIGVSATDQKVSGPACSKVAYRLKSK